MKTTHRHQPWLHHHGLPTFLRRSLSVLGIVLLVLLLIRPGSAQAQEAGTQAYWKQHFVAQVNALIRAPDPALRERGMELIIKYQSQDDAAFDFSSVRPQLYAIFFSPKNSDAQRILALSALYATDSAKTLKMLAEWMQEEDPSVRVRRHVKLALQQRG